MTRFRSISQAIKARLEEIPELAGKVVVYRRSDIESEFGKRMAKTRGKAVVVRLMSSKNASRSKSSFYTGRYSVALFTVPLLTAKDVKDADDLMSEMEAKLHGWWPPEVSSNTAMWLHCEGTTYPDDPTYDVAVLSLTAPGNLK
ncbi:hypothetical protein [Luteolibacter marinus]|uniref:hypothetical protein n=1 Tax=Luteolibacter marinus TaxID=2776705 RepID=UPI00186726AA|nr:hypothetical protein [Luteolibacter marinus]